MKSIIKELSLYATAGTLGMFSFVGCGHSEDTAKEEAVTEESSQEEVTDTKYFDVGEHLFFERYYLTSSVDSQDIAGGSVSIPEGKYTLNFVASAFSFGINFASLLYRILK